MAFTCRLPKDLQKRAALAAARLGISLNGLVAVSLSEYIQSPNHGGKGAYTASNQAQAAPQGVEYIQSPNHGGKGAYAASNQAQAAPQGVEDFQSQAPDLPPTMGAVEIQPMNRAERRRREREARKGR